MLKRKRKYRLQLGEISRLAKESTLSSPSPMYRQRFVPYTYPIPFYLLRFPYCLLQHFFGLGRPHQQTLAESLHRRRVAGMHYQERKPALALPATCAYITMRYGIRTPTTSHTGRRCGKRKEKRRGGTCREIRFILAFSARVGQPSVRVPQLGASLSSRLGCAT